ncbi:alpha-mannosidase 2-like [Ostrea edulis]|uniref:alpha-mannosidase 2-like n=1 Tax=Ostrea edulis TaxID=37623 RepID=UPI0024AFF388|nr:alpha-mannosidase 2-like [Ostrea edulis]XP_056002304.1 alpha-mannosidase 2-like [Ostrea edulis]
MTYLYLAHTIQILPQKNSASVPSFISQHSFLSGSLPCDVHLPNLWSLQQSYDGPITRSDDSALLLHRLKLDCVISSHVLSCTDAQGDVRLRDLLSDTLGVKEMRRTSLILLHDKGPTSLDSGLTLNPMKYTVSRSNGACFMDCLFSYPSFRF